MLQWEDPSNSFLEATSTGNWLQAMIYVVVDGGGAAAADDYY